MKVLLLGGGGREHALGWKLANSSSIETLLVAPGNPGLAEHGAVLPGIDITDPTVVTDVALTNNVDLVIVGPEAPLDAGVSDSLVAAGIPTCGPSKAAARLEGSKAYAKEIMARAGVPTAPSWTFTDFDAAAQHLTTMEAPYVVKADGLAAGKGVLVTEDLIAAQSWARLCLDGHFGDAGSTIVIEHYLAGSEISVFAITDGERAIPLTSARDYKRLLDGGKGPNTGGMGCYTPPIGQPDDLVETAMTTVIEPVLAALADDGVTYRGFLYAGLMLGPAGVTVLEFNARLGDPETQVLMPLLEDDLGQLTLAAATGTLRGDALTWTGEVAVDVVLATDGYPENPQRGAMIKGVADAAMLSEIHVFHAGTTRTEAGLVASGGRVLNVVATANDLATARERAYEAVELIQFDGMQYRTDIAMQPRETEVM